MNFLTLRLALTAIAMAAATSGASAALLSFGVNGIGSYTVNTGDITLATTTKTIPATEYLGGCSTPVACSQAGVVVGGPVFFSTLTFNTSLGSDVFALAAGFLTITFVNVSKAVIVASPNGSISVQYDGFVTGDNSAGQLFLGLTASMTETCTQTSIGAPINCAQLLASTAAFSETCTCAELVVIPGLSVPEPSSLALMVVSLAGLGVFRRRRKSGNGFLQCGGTRPLYTDV